MRVFATEINRSAHMMCIINSIVQFGSIKDTVENLLTV